MEARNAFWRDLGDTLARRYASSSWALLGLLGAVLVPLSLLYLVRGLRLVQYAVGGTVALVGVALAFAYPFYALLGSLFIAYSRLDNVLPGPAAWGLLAIAAGRVLYDWFGGKPLDWGARNFKVSTALLLAIILTSLLFAYDIAYSFVPLEHVLVGLLMYVAVTGLCTTPRRIQQVFLTIAAGFAFQVARYIMALVSAFGSGVVLQPTGKRLAQGEANMTAVIACLLLVPLVHYLSTASWRMRIVVAPVVVINVIAVIISTSRIGMILLALTMAYLLLRSRHRLLYLALVGVGLAVFFINVPSRYWTRFVSLGQLTDIVVDRSLLLRMHALEVGWTIFMDHFWTGVGIGNFGAWSQRYMALGLWAHNTFLDVAATLGIFGILTYIVWLGSGFGMAFAAVKRSRRLGFPLGRGVALDVVAMLALFVIAALTLDLAYNHLLWLLLGCANAIRIWTASRGVTAADTSDTRIP